MLDDLAEFLKPREERVTFGKVKLIVRELDGTADKAFLKSENPEDIAWGLLIRCVFREGGALAFDEKDIPALKKKSPAVTAPLINVVNRVNGLDTGEEAKNSDAAPG